MEGFENWMDPPNEMKRSNHLKWCTRKPLRKQSTAVQRTVQFAAQALFSAQLLYIYTQASGNIILYETPSQIMNLLSLLSSAVSVVLKASEQQSPSQEANAGLRGSSMLNLALLSSAYFLLPVDLHSRAESRPTIDCVSSCILACSYAVASYLICSKTVHVKYWIACSIMISILKIALDLILLNGEQSWSFKGATLVLMVLVFAVLVYALELVRAENKIYLKSERILKDIIFTIPCGIVLFDQNCKPIFTNSKMYHILDINLSLQIETVLAALNSLNFDSYIKRAREGQKSWPCLEHNRNKCDEFCFEKPQKLCDILLNSDYSRRRKFYTKVSTKKDPEECEDLSGEKKGQVKFEPETSLDNELEKNIEHVFERYYIVEVSSFTEEAPFTLLTFEDVTMAKSITESLMEKSFKNDLLKSFSHELKTPLNHSLSQIGCALGDETISPELKMKYLVQPHKSLRLLELMIQDITDFLKLETHQIDINPEKFTISGFFRDAKSLTMQKAKEKGIELTFKEVEDSGLVLLVGDRERLLRVFVNFVLNSIKYTFTGLVKVNCSLIQKEGSEEPVDPEFCLEITDTRFSKTLEDMADYFIEGHSATKFENKSSPLPNENKEFNLAVNKLIMQHVLPNEEKFNCLFSKFGVTYRMVLPCVWRTTEASEGSDNPLEESLFGLAEKTPSLGVYERSLGLLEGSLAELPNIMEINENCRSADFIGPEPEGAMSTGNVEGTPLIRREGAPLILREGSTLIRRATVASNPERTRAKHDCGDATRCFFLIVDDDAFNLATMEMILKAEGLSCLKALNGEAAIEVVKSQCKGKDKTKITLALMDLNMPVMDGFRCAQTMTEMMERGEIEPFPIIACSANDSIEDRTKATDCGMLDFISKPFSRAKVRSALSFLSPQDRIMMGLLDPRVLLKQRSGNF